MLRFLLIEDDISHANLYKKYLQLINYKHFLRVACNIDQGIESLSQYTFDFILLDLELKSGDAMPFLNQLKVLDIIQPYIIAITNSSSELVHFTARKAGADRIFLRTGPDYSPKLVFDHCESVYETMFRDKAPVIISGEIRDKIEKMLSAIGIRGVTGKNYIIEAIYITKIKGKKGIKLNREVYPQIAAKYKKTVSCVERVIKNTIRRAWYTVDSDLPQAGYLSEINKEKAFPTNKEFIYYYAGKL